MQYSMHEAICNYKMAGVHYCNLYLFTPCMECCGHAEIVYAFQSIEKKVKKGSITMAQWINRLRNNSFVNGKGLPLLC